MNRPPASIILRPGAPDDSEAIERVRMDSWRVAYAGIMPQEILDGLRIDPHVVAARWQRILQGKVAATVAEGDGETIGFATYGPSRDEDLDGGELYAIYVRPSHWSTGVGRDLIAAAATNLAVYPRWGLWVLEANARARRFYERYGLRETRRRKELEDFGLMEVHYST